ncbi:hypothetical protein LOTGIDRAFT_196603 [Lottia gigantea]|uniref:Uncharacterized protein n=1 Tax=Lottia gigantea TaxID=225164 RepID=V3ZPV3_LOTGI|nr:hypothetical protein LOTGIDRAFT_196603 [Lottia gigantea]ESO84535.1 hypothetical protein LOTGIDRAFT_196603 [Lottia gigantea]
MAAELSVLRDLQARIKNAKIPHEKLSTLALQGDEELVREFLTESVKIDGNGPTSLNSQLYIACFWGLKDIVEKILQFDIDCNLQNPASRWTPLHAATFQETGPIVMLLLQNGADPNLEDTEGRTPKDFASASDKIWPHFAMLGLKRTSRIELYEKKVLKRGASGNQRNREFTNSIKMSSSNRPESPYAINSDPFVAAAATGDVLADVDNHQDRSTKPNFNMWK